jgi:hypothetical protein
MRMCERLLGLAMQSKELSEDECDVISYYTRELHEKTVPLCSKEPKS